MGLPAVPTNDRTANASTHMPAPSRHAVGRLRLDDPLRAAPCFSHGGYICEGAYSPILTISLAPPTRTSMSAPYARGLQSTVSSRWPAWLDVVQGISGLVLVVFMWAHMFLVASILLGEDAMYFVARLLEGEPLLGKPYPILVASIAFGVFVVFAVHAIVAIRRIPGSYREYRAFLRHASTFGHADTTLWLVQVVTGIVLMFLATAHLYQMLVHPSEIGPYASADRVWSGHWWPLYLVVLFAVELHGGIGIYRLIVKWGWLLEPNRRVKRRGLSWLKWGITSFFLTLGLLTLAAYMKLGYDHRERVGERYVPRVDQVLEGSRGE